MVALNRSISLGHVQITGLSAATGLTAPSGAVRALIQVETQAVRWRDDGADPTAAVGMLLSPGDVLDYDGPLAAIRFVEVTAGAVLNVAYYA